MSMAAYGLGIVVAPVLGPTLGGWLTDTFSWRYAFYINIPVGILAVFMITRFVHDPPYIKNAKVGPFDNIGFGLLIVWTGCLQIVLDKGQEDDWFGALWVRWAVAALVVALIGWIWHSWTNPKGLVDLHVLKDRNFRTGCFLIAMLGMCIYITIAILPLYYQEVLGYTAFTAGLVVGPRGIGSFVGSPIIGFLGSRIDHRKLLCAGFLGFAVCAFIFGTVNLDIGPYTLLIPITLTGFALSFVFVPLATMTTSTISRNEMGNATGLFNMLRNIGGSIGIAMATTALIRRSALHQTYLGAQPLPLQRPSSSRNPPPSPPISAITSAPPPPAPAPSACSTASCSSSPPCWPMSMSSAGPPSSPSSAPPPPGSSKSPKASSRPRPEHTEPAVRACRRQGHRRVQHFYSRPSSIQERNSSCETPLTSGIARRRRTASAICLDARRLVEAIGASCAAGAPRCVITKVSPALT